MGLTDEQKKERKKEYDKKYYEANKQKQKEYRKKWRQENRERKKEYDKKYRDSNKDKIKEYYLNNQAEIIEKSKEYQQTPQGKKCKRILQWKHQGIICEDFDTIYEKYVNCLECEYCNTPFSSDKNRHLDHSHHITDAPNIRGILCTGCNFKDVLKNKVL